MEGLNQLFPIHQIGSDGFAWWIGQIESPMHSQDGEENKDPKRSGRYKVRIIGHHPRSCSAVESKDLPWAITMMPVTTPYSSGAVRSATPQLEPGDWVIGFFLDKEQQQPVIMGSIGQVANSGTSPGEDPNPGQGCKNFTTFIDEDVKQLDQDPQKPIEFDPVNAGVPLDGTPSEKITNGVNNLTIAKFADASESNRAGINFTVEVADKCTGELNGQFKRLLSEMLRDTQQSNGQLGTYVVNQWTGQIYDYVDIGRKYVNKAIYIVRKFVAKVKGFVLEKIKRAVDDLIKAILRPDETGNALTPVTKWFNNMLADLGCSMADLGLRLEKFLEDLIFGYLFDIYKAAACQVDKMVAGILNKIQSLMEDLLSSILGPLQSLLGAIASPLNMIGQAINYVLKLLGIQCNGPDNSCNKVTSVSTKCETDKRKNFLDELLDSLQDPWDGAGEDWATYTCEEAYEPVKLASTEVTFVGGKPITTGLEDRIIYRTFDTTVAEGNKAKILIRREGKTDIASSIFYRTVEGTALFVSDFLETNGTLGFSPGETEKEIEVQTVYSNELETSEDFFVVMRPGTPGTVARSFTKSIARVVITKSKIGSSADPDLDTDDIPTPFKNLNDPNNFDYGEVFDSLANDNDSDTVVAETEGPTYKVSPDRNSVKEGEFITYTIETTNVANGTLFQYQLFGDGITNADIVGGNLLGQFVIENNKSFVVVGIEEDGQLESAESLIFSVIGTDASATVLIESQLSGFGREDLLDEVDESVSLDKDRVYKKIERPIAGSPITDPGGGIIQVPIENPGTAYTEPPAVLITGQGYGAVGIALLDKNNQVSEIRVTNPGFGYKLNSPDTAQKRCIIDSFTMLSPGSGYTSRPNVYVNGDSSVAEAVVENGLVVSVRIKNREKIFAKYPRVQIIGGGGYGARWIPSFNCLSTEALVKVGSAKIGTGSYIDCP
tara:strand:- start:827 stop:3667 length:2841 start_codon:yes stop_codon:yes gene_type:complete